jgi:hypothetical protein
VEESQQDVVHQSPHLQLFFERLLTLKQYCKDKAEASNLIEEQRAFEFVYTELDSLIKDCKPIEVENV